MDEVLSESPGRILDRFAADEHRSVAESLESLRNRLGRDGLSMDEWNALIGAASHLRIEAWRREQSAVRTTPTDKEVVSVLEEAQWYVGHYESKHCCNTALDVHSRIADLLSRLSRVGDE
jgi:hypothetical protein